MSTNNEQVTPGRAMLEELDRRTRPLTISQDMVATNHLIGSLACVLEDVSGGPENFLRCVDEAVEFATRQKRPSRPLTEALEKAARERAELVDRGE